MTTWDDDETPVDDGLGGLGLDDEESAEDEDDDWSDDGDDEDA